MSRVLVRVALALVMAVPAVAQAPQAVTKRLPRSLVLTSFSSFANSYARGNVDEFVQYESGDPTQTASDGSTAFYGFQATYEMALDAEGASAWGAGLQLLKAADHAIWTTIFFSGGGGSDLVFNLWQLNLIATLRTPITAGSRTSLLFEPGIDMGFMTGHYFSGCCSLTAYDASEPGYHFTTGLESRLLTKLAGTLRFGYRSLKIGASYPDPTSSTGYSQTLCCGAGSDPLVVNWSGWFSTIGMSYTIPIRR